MSKLIKGMAATLRRRRIRRITIAELSALIEMEISSNGISRVLQPGVSISISMHATAPGGAED